MSDNKRKNIINIYRRTFNQLSTLSLENIRVEIRSKLGGDSIYFGVTVFDENSENVTFYFYDFNEPKELKKLASKAIELIKQDDFSVVKFYFDKGVKR